MVYYGCMKIYDISTLLTPALVTWPGESGLARSVFKTVEKDGVELSRLELGSHTGTHIDAPRHFVADATGIDSIDLTKCFGLARVLDATSIDHDLTANDLAAFHIMRGERVFFKTKNSLRRLLEDSSFHEDYHALDITAAEYLATLGVVFVGVDYLSCERKGSSGHPVHTTLLKAGIVILEGANLADVPHGQYTLSALPLALPDSDGSPTRAVLIEGL